MTMNLNDPDFCELHCPVCTSARKGNPLARVLQRIEMFMTFGGCPSGRARRKKYGVGPGKAIPLEARSGEAAHETSEGDVQ